MNNERSKIIKQLQERISKIDEEIEKLIQNRYLHTCTIRELSKKTYKEENNNSDSGEEVSGSDLSIEITPPEDRLSSFKSEKKSIKTRAQERQEERDKARAWALDRARARKGERK
jgi:predicted  nucleic acid-binding Zn-ribbon protein